MNNNNQHPRGRSSAQGHNSSGVNISYNTMAAVLCFILVLVNLKVFSMIITDNSSLEKVEYVPEISAEEKKQISEAERIKKDLEENFIPVSVTLDDTKRGELVLVNSTHEYFFDAVSTIVPDIEPLTIPDSTDASYWVKSNYDLLKPEALSEIDRLLTDFAAETGKTDVMILDTYRSFDEQKNVLKNKIDELGEEEGKKIATQPGFSEHHTCLAIDLTLFDGTSYGEYDGKGVYEWITNNCYKYGFVIRYPSDKTHITDITYEPWHLRYVGKAHAYYMTKNSLCLEEYIELLSNLPAASPRLNFTTDDGESYSIYSCEIDAENMTVPVPKNSEYSLSGDNDGRIIVTCKTSV